MSSTVVERQLVGPPVVGPPVEEQPPRLGDLAVVEALHAKEPGDPVPIEVWWQVVEALRRSLAITGVGVDRDRSVARAVVAVERASWALDEDVSLRLARSALAGDGAESQDPVRALHRAQVLVARLVVSPSRTSPTLLQVRLDRLARALLAHLQPA